MNETIIKSLKWSTRLRGQTSNQRGCGIPWIPNTIRRFLHHWTVLCSFLVTVSFLAVVAVAAQNGHAVYTSDNSDWWSHTRILKFDKKSVVQNREPSASNSRFWDSIWAMTFSVRLRLNLERPRPLREVMQQRVDPKSAMYPRKGESISYLRRARSANCFTFFRGGQTGRAASFVPSRPS